MACDVGLRCLQRVQAYQVGIADPGSGKQAVGGNQDGDRNQWQFHGVPHLDDGAGPGGF